MASTSTNSSVNSVSNEINGDVNGVVSDVVSVALRQLRQQPDLTTIQHNLKTDKRSRN